MEIAPDQIATMIIQLVEEEKIQQEATKIYENTLFYSEWGIASSIERLLARKKKSIILKRPLIKAAFD